MSRTGLLLLLVGLAGLLHALRSYTVARRDPRRDQMGASIAFDRRWMLCAAAGAIGARLLWGLGWGGFAGLVLLAYAMILPLKAGVKRALGR